MSKTSNKQCENDSNKQSRVDSQLRVIFGESKCGSEEDGVTMTLKLRIRSLEVYGEARSVVKTISDAATL